MAPLLKNYINGAAVFYRTVGDFVFIFNKQYTLFLFRSRITCTVIPIIIRSGWILSVWTYNGYAIMVFQATLNSENIVG